MKSILLVSVVALVLAITETAQGKTISKRAEPEVATGPKALAIQPGQAPKLVRAVENEVPEHENNLRGISIEKQHARLARDAEDEEIKTGLRGMSIERSRAKLVRAVAEEEVQTGFKGMKIENGLARPARSEEEEETHIPALEVTGKRAKVIR